MIAEEDIKIGAIVRHLGHPGDWGQTCADHFALFNVTEDYDDDGDFFTKDSVHIAAVKANTDLFEPVVTIARPVLAERKVGKVAIELVDTGFPHSLWELAKVLGWAAEHKGYKMNDWKNMPDAKIAFQAAASRHRMKPLLGEEFDPESGLHHKVHELFNVAAELELILTGKIK